MKEIVAEKFETFITAAFSLVAALAWNSAVQKIFEQYSGTQNTIPAMFIYAVLVTLLAVFVTLTTGKLAQKVKR